ncbi:MAG: DUF971 domain-containing protein [Burkholderiaceae bacterium]
MNALPGSLDEHLFPEAIVNHQASGVLELRWHDGSESHLAHGLLRARCRCAGCQQLYRQQGNHPEAIATIRLEAINPISDKGLNLVFSDGHGRGIFPWAYLHELSALITSSTN